MPPSPPDATPSALPPALAERLAATGARIALRLPGAAPLTVGPPPAAATVEVRDPALVDAFVRGDHLALAEAHLDGRIELEGDLREVMRATDALVFETPAWQQALFALRLALPTRRRWNRRSIAFHYDRPPGFFLPWLERWRSYSHGFYAGPDDDPSAAQARKMQHAIRALGLEPGMHVFDMGGGWGCFVEYAGLRGIHVHAITISREQHRFVAALIREKDLPCTVELVDFLDHRPTRPYDGAVFMGTLEHVPDYRRVARFLQRHLVPGGRVYADFCARREGFLVSGFLARHIWPGTATYVNVPKLVAALAREGLELRELGDDTRSYAWTVRDWADRLEAVRKPLAEAYGEPAVRAFLLFLRGSEHFLETRRTLAYHLVAARPAG